jgi:hypothetical protein
MSHPEFEYVFSGCALLITANMSVHINKSGQDIHPTAINFFAPGF